MHANHLNRERNQVDPPITSFPPYLRGEILLLPFRSRTITLRFRAITRDLLMTRFVPL
jgi:hypothetical protein